MKQVVGYPRQGGAVRQLWWLKHRRAARQEGGAAVEVLGPRARRVVAGQHGVPREADLLVQDLVAGQPGASVAGRAQTAGRDAQVAEAGVGLQPERDRRVVPVPLCGREQLAGPDAYQALGHTRRRGRAHHGMAPAAGARNGRCSSNLVCHTAPAHTRGAGCFTAATATRLQSRPCRRPWRQGGQAPGFCTPSPAASARV